MSGEQQAEPSPDVLSPVSVNMSLPYDWISLTLFALEELIFITAASVTPLAISRIGREPMLQYNFR